MFLTNQLLVYILARPLQETVRILWEKEPTCASLDQFFKKSHKSVWVSKLYPLHWTLKYRLITKQKYFNDDIFRHDVMIGIIILLQYVRREHSSVRQKISATYLVSAVTELPTVRTKRMRLTAVSENWYFSTYVPETLLSCMDMMLLKINIYFPTSCSVYGERVFLSKWPLYPTVLSLWQKSGLFGQIRWRNCLW